MPKSKCITFCLNKANFKNFTDICHAGISICEQLEFFLTHLNNAIEQSEYKDQCHYIRFISDTIKAIHNHLEKTKNIAVHINKFDFSLLLQSWEKNKQDLNGDGIINYEDFVLFYLIKTKHLSENLEQLLQHLEKTGAISEHTSQDIANFKIFLHNLALQHKQQQQRTTTTNLRLSTTRPT